MTKTNTPRDFAVDRYRNFAEIFTYNETYLFNSKTFLDAKSKTLTYGQLFDLTARLAGFFAENKLERGDRAVIISKDNIAVTTIFMACLRYGLTAVILNPRASEDEQNNLIKAAKPKALFMDEHYFEKLDINSADFVDLRITPDADHRKPGIASALLGKKADNTTFPQILYSFEPAQNLNDNPVPLDTVAYILFTSGTTSRPKGVEITHGNLLAQMKTFVRHYGYKVTSEILNILPLHHTDGLTQGPVVAFTIGCSVYRPLRFAVNRLPELLDSIYKHKVTHFVAVPSMLQLIDALGTDIDDTFRTPHFQFIISTAGYLDPNLWERFEKRFGTKIVNVYGLTETVCEALYCGPSEETRKIGTIGKPVDTECRIVDDQGNDLPPNQSGELWVKGPHIMKGYFEMPEETAEVLTEDGWFKTGDLCQVDDEGFYHIVSRKKNIIIVGGINVYPDDVANILRSLPGVLDAVVWGEEDPTWGETVVGAIIPKGDEKPDTNILGEEFLHHGTVEMLPRRIHVVEEFPRGPAGKVIVRDLREQIAGAQEKSDQVEDSSDSLEDKVLAIAAQSFKCTIESLSTDSTAETTKGWNSLAHVEFLLSIEKAFSIKIEPRDILAVRSVGDALDIVKTKTSKAA